MPMIRTVVPTIVLALTLAACTPQDGPDPDASVPAGSPAAATPAMPGSDQDEHGCKASAGYVWCPRTAQCERPWELVAARNLGDSPQAFDDWCAGSDQPSSPPAGDD